MGNDEGWVSVGDSADTAEFAVESIRRSWNPMGRARFPDADHRRRRRLQRPEGAGVEVAPGPPRRRDRPHHHRVPLPAGHIEVEPDRAPPVLFISLNWRGRPLTDIRTIV